MELKRIIEAVLFSSARSITAKQMIKKLDDFPPEEVLEALSRLIAEYNSADRAFLIAEVSGGFQMQTKAEYGDWVKRFVREKEMGLTRSVMETLSIIAYKQPVPKKEIDRLRGVDSSRAVKQLLERKLIELGGRLEDAGKPMVFRTTKLFLETFCLKNTADLPTLKEIASLDA
ncbi:MAG: SMC-Scp complex subunit ScpB [Syntrophobacterales bacterium]|jgi:segregation and condensation protein B|nr:SMC-Scp complex subunit ScpB [Syntrophobacterales bacterium]